MHDLSSSDLTNVLGALAPPERFRSARLADYRAETGGQEEALEKARALVERLEAPAPVLERLQAFLPGTTAAPPKGLYLVGPAGTGKTHLMAAIYHRLMPEVPCAFMHSSQLFRATVPPKPLAEALARKGPAGEGCRLLMLDEVELDDAANEARLAHFLRVLSDEGVALVATSNARPNEFLSLHLSNGSAHRRFLTDALSGHCEIVFVEGKDRRRTKEGARRGRIVVGPLEEANARLREAFERDERKKRWVSFDEVRKASTELAHGRLMKRVLALDGLYIHSVDLTGTDDALRLLRIIDDLYVKPEAPALFFSATAPPEEWFSTEARAGVAGAIAEKFDRTVSRLSELCEVEHVAEAK